MSRSHLQNGSCCWHDVGMGKHLSDQRRDLNGDGSAASARGTDTGSGSGRHADGALGRLSRAARLAIVAESFADGAVIADVARRHGLRPQRLFAWRSAARAKLRPDQPDHRDSRPLFVPALVGISGEGTDAVPAAGALPIAASPDDASSDDFGTIEIALGGAVIRVRGAIDAAALCAVLKALKAAS